MISHLSGTLVKAWPTQIVIEVGGVGYEVTIPLNCFDALPRPPSKIRLLTHLVVREDSHQLFGFLADEERDLFRMLIDKVSGIGPKTALDVLSGISAAEFKVAVIQNDTARLARIKGIGKKTADRIVFELKDKIGIAGAWEAAALKSKLSIEDRAAADAVLALISLGYKQAEAHKAIRAAQEKLGSEPPVESLVREALRLL